MGILNSICSKLNLPPSIVSKPSWCCIYKIENLGLILDFSLSLTLTLPINQNLTSPHAFSYSSITTNSFQASILECVWQDPRERALRIVFIVLIMNIDDKYYTAVITYIALKNYSTSFSLGLWVSTMIARTYHKEVS